MIRCDVYLSYDEADTRYAHEIRMALEADGRAVLTRLDSGASPQLDIRPDVDAAYVVVVVLSEAYFASAACQSELHYAAQIGKKLIFACLTDPVERWRRDDLLLGYPKVLLSGERAALDQNLQQLGALVDEDYSYVRDHTRLLLQAREWDYGGRRAAELLLSGYDLERAERWQIMAAAMLPAPTALQMEFIFASRRAAQRRVRRFGYSLLAALLLTFTGLLVAGRVYEETLAALETVTAGEEQAQRLYGTSSAIELTQRADLRAANRRADELRSIGLASAAQLALANDDTDLAIALAHAANRIASPPRQAVRALAEAVYAPGTRLALTLNNSGAAVTASAFHPAAFQAAVGDQTGRVTLLDLTTGAEIAALQPEGISGAALTLAYTPDGLGLVAVWQGGAVGRYDLEAGEWGWQATAGEFGIRSAAIHAASGQMLINACLETLCQSTRVSVWEIGADAPLRELLRPDETLISGLGWHPDGESALLVVNSGRLSAWNTRTGARTRRYQPGLALTNSFAYIGGGGRIVIPSGRVLIEYDLLAGVQTRSYYKEGAAIQTAAVSADGLRLAAGDADGVIWVWSVGESIARRRLRGHTERVACLSFSADGRWLLSGTASGKLRLWDLENGAQLTRLDTRSYPITSLAYDPASGRLATGDTSGVLRLVDSLTDVVTAEYAAHLAPISRVAFIDGGARIVTASQDDSAAVWTLSGERQVHFVAHDASLWALAVSPDGRWIATGGADRTILIWEATTGAVRQRLTGHADWVLGLAFTPDGAQLLSAGRDTTMFRWDVATGEQIGALVGHGDSVWDIAVSPNGERALSASQDGSLILWDLADGSMIYRLSGHSAAVNRAIFSADGLYAISGGQDRQVLIWNLAAGQPIYPLAGHREAIWGLALDPAGRRAFSTGSDATIRAWHLDYTLENLLEWARESRYVRDLTPAEQLVYSPAGR